LLLQKSGRLSQHTGVAIIVGRMYNENPFFLGIHSRSTHTKAFKHFNSSSGLKVCNVRETTYRLVQVSQDAQQIDSISSYFQEDGKAKGDYQLNGTLSGHRSTEWHNAKRKQRDVFVSHGMGQFEAGPNQLTHPIQFPTCDQKMIFQTLAFRQGHDLLVL